MTMNKSARPSLYSGTSSGNTAEVFNILGVLEPPRRTVNPVRRAALVLLVAFAGAGAVMAFNNFPELRSHTMVLVNSAFSREETAGQKVAAPAIPVLAAAKPQDAQASVAKIVSDEPADLQTPGSLDLVAQTNIGLPVPSPLPEVAARSIMDAENPSSPHVAVNASPDKRSGLAQHAAETTGSKPAPPEKTRTVQAARQAASKPQQPHHHVRRKDDRDVDLIAALLTRVSATDTVEKSAKNAVIPKGRNAPASQKESSTGSSNEKPNRDLVLNQAHEPLSVLVRRCRALGLVEGELCRLRICSGSWGKDPACPASGLPPEN